jgi:hypothetical protein
VVRTQGGAENVTYEGIRCETAERKLYAIGRKPGDWVASRNVEWRQIEEKTANRVHAALAKDYFCPPGVVPRALGRSSTLCAATAACVEHHKKDRWQDMLDQLIIGFDKALRTVFANAHTVRPTPGEQLPEAELSDEESAMRRR